MTIENDPQKTKNRFQMNMRIHGISEITDDKVAVTYQERKCAEKSQISDSFQKVNPLSPNGEKLRSQFGASFDRPKETPVCLMCE